MNTFRKTKSLSIFFKLLAVFLMLFIPLYAVSLEANIRSQNSVREEISRSVIYQMDKNISDLENEVRSVSQMLGYLKTDNDFKRLAIITEIMSSDEKVSVLKNVRDKLFFVKNNSKNIHEIRAHFPLSNYSISSTGTVGNFNAREFDMTRELYVFPFAYDEGRLLLSTFSTSSLGKTNTPVLNIVVEMSKEAISNNFLEFIKYEGGGAVLTDNAHKWEIFSRGGSDMGKSISKAYLLNPVAESIVKINKENYIVLGNKSDYLNITVLAYIPEKEVLGYLKTNRKWIWGVSAFSVLGIILFCIWIYRMIEKPLMNLLNAFRKVDEGELDISIEHKSNDEFRYIYIQFNRMFDKLKLMIKQTYEQKLLARTMELKHLQNQINSHFLYNCFYIISHLAKIEDNENTMRLSQYLAAYYQFVTSSSSDETTLKEEAEHARNYVKIQNFRFSERISCEFDDIPEGCIQMKVPRLILQPLIENCYKHGLRSKINDGIISVKMVRSDEYLNFRVEDNGDDLEDDKLEELQREASSGEFTTRRDSGLQNIHRRLQIKYGTGSGISFSRSKLGGLCAEMKIKVGREE